jgi:LysM repeat protein
MAALAGPLVIAGLVLASCGGSEGNSTPTIVQLNESAGTNYQTLPPQTLPPTSVTTPPTSDPADGGAPAAEYTIQSGDYPLGIAGEFGVQLADLAAINNWADCAATGCPSFPGPGTVIKIPAGGTPPADSGDTPDDEPDETGSTIPASGDNCKPGTYTVKAGDFPNGVAADFGVSFERLQAANPGVDFATTFSVGMEIVIPAKEDC